MAKKNVTLSSPYFKRKQVCLKGKTLLMFEYDVKEQETKESTLLCHIVKEYYKNKPPFGYKP